MRVNEFAWGLYNSNPENEPKQNMSPDIHHIVSNFEKHQVAYILIGGFAMAFHGHVRATNDIDFWIKNTPENMRHLREALIDSGFPEAKGLRDTTQLVGGFAVFNTIDSDFKVDLFHNLKAFKEKDFDTCFKRVKMLQYKGVSIPVLEAKDLLHEKESTAREKDLGDISFLKKLISKINRSKGQGL